MSGLVEIFGITAARGVLFVIVPGLAIACGIVIGTIASWRIAKSQPEWRRSQVMLAWIAITVVSAVAFFLLADLFWIPQISAPGA